MKPTVKSDQNGASSTEPTKTTDAADMMEVTEDAHTLVLQGIQSFHFKDYKKSCNHLSTACQLLAEQHGELGEECSAAYLWYGKALLQQARKENEVLGNALEGSKFC